MIARTLEMYFTVSLSMKYQFILPDQIKINTIQYTLCFIIITNMNPGNQPPPKNMMVPVDFQVFFLFGGLLGEFGALKAAWLLQSHCLYS